MDVVDLRRRFGHRMAFCGNSDIQVWETRRPRGHPPRGAAQAQRGRGGGFIFQSDHSVTSAVSGPTYDYIVKLVREFGQYPLRLGEFEEAI